MGDQAGPEGFPVQKKAFSDGLFETDEWKDKESEYQL